ncbi:unnamed protein product [Brachionus calyciflorus]|uniref:Heparan-sulfate 6-O-sulfotransferase n=1 Tax=Brachionus calyciflorus TaxID=104777 RepID=A0A813S9F1_9BILA|nr:unnamed protein product [Brachionus calyciflorus]
MLRNPIKRYLSEWNHVKNGAQWIDKFNNRKCLYKNYLKCFKGQKTWNASLDDFMSCEYNLANNRQTLLLSDSNYDCSNKTGEEMLEEAKRNLESLSFFGLTEYHDLNRKLFLKIFGGSFRFLKEFKTANQTVADNFYKLLKTKGVDITEENSDKILKKIQQLNSLDIQLYEFAKDLFFKRLKFYNIL